MSKKSAVRTGNSVLPVYIGGAVVCFVVTAGFLCLFSIVLCKSDISRDLLVPFSMIISCLGVAGGAYTLSVARGERGLLLGAALGFVFFAILILLALVTRNSEFSALALLRLVLLLVAGAAGGYLGMSQKEKSKRRH